MSPPAETAIPRGESGGGPAAPIVPLFLLSRAWPEQSRLAPDLT